jgi:hypothetical protein
MKAATVLTAIHALTEALRQKTQRSFAQDGKPRLQRTSRGPEIPT